jgi:hypothetical protein
MSTDLNLSHTKNTTDQQTDRLGSRFGLPGHSTIRTLLLGCDFFEHRGEKRIDVGTLLAFLFFSFSDGVLCFHHIFCVFFLALVPLQVRVCAYGRIDIFSRVIILPDDATSSVI